MSAMNHLAVTSLLAFTGFNNAYALRVTLYDHINFEGESKTHEFTAGCKNFLEFNDRASSLKSDGCVKAWENSQCKGRAIEIGPPGSDNLVKHDFNDMISSVSDCSFTGKEIVDTVRINMDTSKAPELAEFGRKVKKVMEDWFPFVQMLMTTSAYKPIYEIDVTISPDIGGVAGAAGQSIYANANFFKNHQDDFGAFIHEMTHCIHQASTCPGWMVEGFAEWTRRWFYEPWTAYDNPPRADQSYKDGYTTAAWLMVYINSKITDKPVMYTFNKMCQAGNWRDSIFEELTGKTVDQLWSDMLNDKGYPWKKQ